MKIVSLMILRALTSEQEATTLASSFYLTNFNYFQRDSVKQFATFISKTVAKRVDLGQRSSIEHEGHLVHVQVRASGLAAVAVCDEEYPPRVAFTLLMKVLDDFCAKYSDETVWKEARTELEFTELDGVVEKYQDPHEADAIMRIQKDLDDTKIILHKTIDSVLERGVKLDNLVEKSTDLSAQSKMYVYYKKKLHLTQHISIYRCCACPCVLTVSFESCSFCLSVCTFTGFTRYVFCSLLLYFIPFLF